MGEKRAKEENKRKMEGTESKKMNIVYASDENFAEMLSVSMESLLTHNKNVVVYVLNNGIKEKSVEKLKRQAERHEREIHFMPLKNLKEYAGRELSCQSKISLTAYFRLFMPQILPLSVEKLLYLDCDTMVRKDLTDLWERKFDGCAAVAEPTAPLMKEKIGLKKSDYYFNSGVLLVDLKKWREEKIMEKFVKYMEEMGGDVSFEDQGVINHVLKNEISILPFKYNVTTQFFDFGYDGFSMMKKDEVRYERNEVEAGLENPGIVHFTNSFASERPWVKGCEHKYANEWRQYKKNTEWSDSPIWESNKDFARKISRIIYSILKGDMRYLFIYFANGIIRPKISSGGRRGKLSK